jgi:predicted nucleic-acid-binding Zn-ribbon protein
MRAEGGFLSAAFDISTNRFIAVSCERCGFTELYRKDVAGASKIFDFLVS